MKKILLLGTVIGAIILGVVLSLTQFESESPTSTELALQLDSNLDVRTNALPSEPKPSSLPNNSPSAEQAVNETSVATQSLTVTSPADPTPIKNPAHLIVVVVDQRTELPLANVSVQVQANDSSTSLLQQGLTQLSDAEGVALFDVEADQPLKLVAGLQDEEQTEMIIPALAEAEIMEWVVKLQATRGFTFYGKVVDHQNGKPIAGAKVWMPGDEDDDEVIDQTRSDTSGNFGFNLPVGSAKLAYASTTGFGRAAFRVTDRVSSPDRPLTIQLRPTGKLRVVVKDSTGAPVSGIDVIVSTSGFHTRANTAVGDFTFRVPDPTWTGSTDYNGESLQDELLSGVPLQVDLKQGDEVLQSSGEPIFIEPGTEKRWDVVLGGGGTVVGKLLDHSQQPIVNYPVWLVRESQFLGEIFSLTGLTHVEATTTTSDDGSFQFNNVQIGTWRVGPAVLRKSADMPLSERVTPVNRPFSIEKKETVEVTVVAQQGVYISGKVLDMNNLPVANTLISGRKEGRGFYYQSANTATDGTFVLGPVEPGILSLKANPVTPQQTESLPIQAEAGDDDVLLRLGVGGKVSGKIIEGESGNPIQASVLITGNRAADGTRMFYPSRQRNSDQFNFDSVAPGTYTLNATSEAGAEGELSFELRAGEQLSDLVVTLWQTGKLFLTYQGNLTEAIVTARNVEDGKEYGYASFNREQSLDGSMLLKAGKYQLLLRDGDRNIIHETDFTIATGEEKRIVVSDEGVNILN